MQAEPIPSATPRAFSPACLCPPTLGHAQDRAWRDSLYIPVSLAILLVQSDAQPFVITTASDSQKSSDQRGLGLVHGGGEVPRSRPPISQPLPGSTAPTLCECYLLGPAHGQMPLRQHLQHLPRLHFPTHVTRCIVGSKPVFYGRRQLIGRHEETCPADSTPSSGRPSASAKDKGR
jgi:hypothetical protein